MLLKDILLPVAGVIVGVLGTLAYIKYRSIQLDLEIISQRLIDVESKIISPEEMAKEVIKVKFPLNELPPDVLDKIKKEAEEISEKGDNGMEYFG